MIDNITEEEKHKLSKKLFEALITHGTELQAFSTAMADWHEKEIIYRFYHYSFKVFGAKELITDARTMLQKMLPECPLTSFFTAITNEALEKSFRLPETNQNWLAETRPLVEGFMHAKFFIDTAAKFSRSLTSQFPEAFLPTDWAALLCLYDIR